MTTSGWVIPRCRRGTGVKPIPDPPISPERWSSCDAEAVNLWPRLVPIYRFTAH